MLSASIGIVTDYPHVTPNYIFKFFIFLVGCIGVVYHSIKLRKERLHKGEKSKV